MYLLIQWTLSLDLKLKKKSKIKENYLCIVVIIIMMKKRLLKYLIVNSCLKIPLNYTFQNSLKPSFKIKKDFYIFVTRIYKIVLMEL
jgi:hypothetical protein